MKRTFLSLTIILGFLTGCIKSEDPCHGITHIRADFQMKEFCNNNLCPDLWLDYVSDRSSGGWMRFVSTSYIHFPAIPSDTVSYEWHIGAGIYHGDSIELNFSNVANGSVIPIMLIIKQKANPGCIKNDNGIDTVLKSMKIDRGTRMCYAQWRGIYLDAPSDTTTIIIGKGFSQSLSDSIAFIKYLYPATIDTLMGRLSTKEEYIQEIAVGLSGNNLYSSGSALTDSTGQNITIYYHYENLPNTETHYRTFKGKRI